MKQTDYSHLKEGLEKFHEGQLVKRRRSYVGTYDGEELGVIKYIDESLVYPILVFWKDSGMQDAHAPFELEPLDQGGTDK